MTWKQPHGRTPPPLPSLATAARSRLGCSTLTISASDSTIHCETERHLISMTTKKDTIPSWRKINSNSAPFVPRQRAHMDECEVSYTRTGARQSTGYRRTKFSVARESVHSGCQIWVTEAGEYTRNVTFVLVVWSVKHDGEIVKTFIHSFIHS